MKSLFITAASLTFLTISCMENKSENKATPLQAIFPKGEKGPAEHFTGNAFNTGLWETYTLNRVPGAIGTAIRQARS
jgi:hypothetical protein